MAQSYKWFQAVQGRYSVSGHEEGSVASAQCRDSMTLLQGLCLDDPVTAIKRMEET